MHVPPPHRHTSKAVYCDTDGQNVLMYSRCVSVGSIISEAEQQQLCLTINLLLQNPEVLKPHHTVGLQGGQGCGSKMFPELKVFDGSSEEAEGGVLPHQWGCSATRKPVI